jgi:glycosyltransferase 2 family protein
MIYRHLPHCGCWIYRSLQPPFTMSLGGNRTSILVWTRLRKTMRSARIIVTIGVLALLGALIFRAMSTLRRFDWPVFYSNARYISVWHSIGAVAFIYAGFLLRAVRWSVFLRPVKKVSAARLFGPTVVGFAGLAIMGYPGELIRPCLIARREGLSISSQMAALTLERILDIASVGLLISAAILGSSELQVLSIPPQFRRAGLLLMSLAAFLGLLTILLANKGEKIAVVLQHLLSPLSNRLAHSVARLTNAFCINLNNINDVKSLAQVIILSVAIWFLIALAYLETLHAFGALRPMSLVQALLLLGFALLGSLVQLPAGGTQQVIVIAVLISVFRVPAELAASCGILLWLTIMMAPVPVGLVLVCRARLSLRSFSHAGRRTAEKPCAERDSTDKERLGAQ